MNSNTGKKTRESSHSVHASSAYAKCDNLKVTTIGNIIDQMNLLVFKV